MAPISCPAPARETRRSTRGGTQRTSCDPFALFIDLGERSQAFALPKLLFKVEPLSDARTTLADIFTILLDAASPPPHSCQRFFDMKLNIVIRLFRQDSQQGGDDL